MLQEVMWAYCDQFHVVFVLSALWYYDQQKSEVGRDRDWEEWDSGCHRTCDSDSSSNFDVHNMYLDMVNIFQTTIVTYRPIWKWSVSSILWALLLREISTACLDMKEDRNKKSALVCDGWSCFLDASSCFGRDFHSRWKSITWFTSSHEGGETTALLRKMDVGIRGRDWHVTRIFTSYQAREVCKW